MNVRVHLVPDGDLMSKSNRGFRVAVILPALNEELTVAGTIREFHHHLPDAQIWVIDNASTDRTASVARSALGELEAGGGVISEPARGKGNAVRRAFHDIEADVYVLADADLTYPAASAASLIRPIVDGEADMVVGDRISTGSYNNTDTRRFHGLGNQIVSYLVNAIYKSSLRDVMSGFRVFNRHFVKSYPILVAGFQIETDLSLHALDKRFRVLEKPISYQNRPAGSNSKLSTFSDGTKVIGAILRIFRLYKPFAFFGSMSLLALLVALVIGVPIVVEWSESGLVPRLPSALLATGLGVSAVVLFSMALILDALAQHDKRVFELHLLGRAQEPNWSDPGASSA